VSSLGSVGVAYCRLRQLAAAAAAEQSDAGQNTTALIDDR